MKKYDAIIIATIIPSIKGIESNPFVYTSTSIMEQDKLPRRLTIVGGGYIGLEFASIFANFGSEVTVLEGGDKFIPREDRDIAVAVKEVLENCWLPDAVRTRKGWTSKLPV